MKGTVWTVIILTAVIVAVGIASTSISANISHDFSQDLSVVEESIRKENWEEAMRAVDDMILEWEETCQWLQIWVNHTDTDDVNMAIERLAAAIELNDKYASLIIGAELGESLRHIYHRDALTIANIL